MGTSVEQTASGFTVRPAAVSDVPGVLPMVATHLRAHEQADPDRFAFLPDVIARYERWLPQRAADPRSVFLIAESGGTLIGFLVGTREQSIPIYRVKEFGFIHDVWVEPAHRRRGVARALVEETVRRFAAFGVVQVRLETTALNETARDLFASCGFRTSTVEMLRVV